PPSLFHFTHPTPPSISTLSLHDALPIFISDSMPPRDSARVNSLVLSAILRAAASPPLNCTETMPPKPDICFLAISWPGWSSKPRSEEHTSELQSRFDLVCRLLLEKKNRR